MAENKLTKAILYGGAFVGASALISMVLGKKEEIKQVSKFDWKLPTAVVTEERNIEPIGYSSPEKAITDPAQLSQIFEDEKSVQATDIVKYVVDPDDEKVALGMPVVKSVDQFGVTPEIAQMPSSAELIIPDVTMINQVRENVAFTMVSGKVVNEAGRDILKIKLAIANNLDQTLGMFLGYSISSNPSALGSVDYEPTRIVLKANQITESFFNIDLTAANSKFPNIIRKIFFPFSIPTEVYYAIGLWNMRPSPNKEGLFDVRPVTAPYFSNRWFRTGW